MRKPLQLEMRGLKTPRERMWEAIRSLKKGFTRLSVGDACNPVCTHAGITYYFDHLIRAGYIALSAKGKRRPGQGSIADADTYDLVKDQFEAPRVTVGGKAVTKGMTNLAMWRAIRVLAKGFDFHDVAKAASVDGFKVATETARKYVYLLWRAGYFTVIEKARPNKAARYKLAKNTGPHAPVLAKPLGVFDRNTGEFTSTQTPQEVCDAHAE
ncbi:MAG: hypothetical protein HYX47_10360 [Burkholderiales bacterium]|nr:hypothetical protein [Burkholderiales bacterium]